MAMIDNMTHLDESLNQNDPSKMSYIAKPGEALQNYLKE